MHSLTPLRARHLGTRATAPPGLAPPGLVLLGLVLLAAACARGGVALAPAATPAPHLPSPPAGVGCTVPAASLPPVPGYGVAGPAVTSLTGGAATEAFSLDSGGLSVQPPATSDHPAVSAGSAECDALASLDAFGYSFSDLARNGMAVG